MKWIYILKCENNIYYVGQTSRLYRRFWEHHEGRGGINTSINTPEEIVAIYKVSDIIKFIDYNEEIVNINNENDNDLKYIYYDGFNNPNYVLNNWDDIDSEETEYDSNICENNITECMMINNKNNWKNIRGGKYVRYDCNYKFPNNEYIKELPLCNCKLPCDVRKHPNKGCLFFRCAKKNMWKKLKQLFNIYDEPCKFYREYITDIELRIEYKKKNNERRKIFGELIKKSSWLENIPLLDNNEKLGNCIICNTYVWRDLNNNIKKNGIIYNDYKRLLCIDCFINKNEELNKKYSIYNTGKCLISL